MKINNDKSTYKPPFTVVLLDAMDAYYYADVMEKMEEVARVETYEKAVAIADALFVVKNHGWESLQAMNGVDGGYDVRVYDSTMACVYAAHTKYINKWIGVADIQQNKPNSLMYSGRVQKAIRFSIKTHEVYQKQKRKGKDIPYITHPLAVGLILARSDADEDTIIAGILHDTIEDSVPEKKATKEMIAERFGENIATIVESVTEQNKALPWEKRKSEALEHIKKFSHESLLVKSADVISNASEIVADFDDVGDEVFAHFNAPRDRILGHYRAVISAIQHAWPDIPLAQDLAEADIQLSRIFALGQGNLQYAEWSISFIEYEMKRIFSESKYYSEIMAACADFHATIQTYGVTNDITELQTNVHDIADRLHKIIKATDGDEKETMTQFLLTSHFADMLNSFRAYISEKRE
ncbi:MAG: HD domain-containing protein [Candidatus Yonathbacteria bacterium]|nr:HD domain-containing protein [Candidatus Yonathbacteria bacterium]